MRASHSSLRRTKQQFLRAAERLGVERQLRQAQRVLEPGSKRRNRRDDENLRLLFAAALTPDANCIDVGANVGSTLASVLGAAPHGRHIAYEPLPALCDTLRRRFPTVDVRQVALSNCTGEADFVHVKHLPSRSGLRLPDYARSQTEILRTVVSRLDEMLEPDYAPALIKIDVEGAERHVLEGAIETVRRHLPTVVFEHDPRWAARYETSSTDIYRLLTGELALRVFDMDGHGPYSHELFVSAAHKGERWNFFARP